MPADPPARPAEEDVPNEVPIVEKPAGAAAKKTTARKTTAKKTTARKTTEKKTTARRS